MGNFTFSCCYKLLSVYLGRCADRWLCVSRWCRFVWGVAAARPRWDTTNSPPAFPTLKGVGVIQPVTAHLTSFAFWNPRLIVGIITLTYFPGVRPVVACSPSFTNRASRSLWLAGSWVAARHRHSRLRTGNRLRANGIAALKMRMMVEHAGRRVQLGNCLINAIRARFNDASDEQLLE